ncbi:MAG: ABC transporter ATP-binding protein/permease [Treponema sp.]|nr:ABC transporter ATP-binding protein/permease [Treponema sp.]
MTRRHRILMILVLVMTIGFSLVETIGISAIMPFISIVSNPQLLEAGFYKTAFDFLGFSSPEKFIIVFGISIIIFYLFRGAYSIMLAYITKRYSVAIYTHFSKKLFKINLSVPYKVYAQKNSAELMRSIGRETDEIGKVTFHLLNICSEIFTILMVYAVIVYLNWKMTIIITGILLIFVIIILSYLAKVNAIQGKISFTSGRNMNRALKESLGNLKYVKLKGNEDEILKTYNNALEKNSKSEMVTYVMGAMPKSILESLGFSFLIAVVVFIVWLYKDASMVIPIISMYALALYRILPSIHRMLLEINGILFSEETIKNVYDSLSQPVEEEGFDPVNFISAIRLENICFNYMTGGEVISGVSLEIRKGEKIAITGESGGGKSTLVDIITGIHKPVLGKVYIDDTLIADDNIRSWRKKIGYIPQSIYLFDGTVAENVSFGSTPDDEKIITALKKANIWDFLSHKDGIHTKVGDGGIQLSGGQQQRIGIARALYDDPEVLVLDEATSALDNETEQKIMDEIYSVSANKTLIVIAHRLTTVERCDRIIRIENGRIV